MAGRLPPGPVLIYDDDHYYMANVIAERLRAEDIAVTLVTPSNQVSSWGGHTSEQALIHRRMLQLGVDLVLSHGLSSYDGHEAVLECTYSGKQRRIAAASLVTVTMRAPDDALFRELQQRVRTGADSVPKTLTRIGDCEAPAIIAGAVFAGHRYARELDTEVDPDHRIRYDRVFYEDTEATAD